MLDEFNDIAYDNQDGTLLWADGWDEDDPLGRGPAGGLVRVVPEGWLRLGDNPDSGEQPSASRNVDLGESRSSFLSFDFVITSGADPGDVAVVEVSPDGVDWTVLEEFVGLSLEKAIFGSRTFDVSDFMTRDFRVRYRIDTGFGEISEFLYIDNVKVTVTCDELGSIGDRVWLDDDGDGEQDPTEGGINGVTMFLLDDGGNVLGTQATAGDGIYQFTDLPAGTYTVAVDPGTLPDGVTPTFDPDGGLDNRATGLLEAGANSTVIDFGYEPAPPPLGSICGTVWEDTNADGQQNNGEPGLPDITVTLKDENGNVITTTVTDANGDYCFEDLPASTYRICVDPPDGLDPTFDPDGDLDNETEVDLDPGENEEDVDFGYTPDDPDVCPPTLDFETDVNGHPLEAGQIIDDEIAGMTLSTNDPVNHPLMIFDSANPTGGDLDLGTPNQDFGGPGIGAGGGAGEPGENALPRGKVLIISEDGDSSDPDDNGGGGTITFTFDHPVELSHVGLLDIEEEGGTVVAYDENGAVLVESEIPVIGDNGYQVVLVGASEVAELDVNLASSGAVTEVAFCPELCVFNWNGIGGRAFYMPDISKVLAFEPDPGRWTELPDGTATMVGEITDQNAPGDQGFRIDLEFSGRYSDGSWVYYSEWSGTLNGTGNWEGAVLEIVGTGDDFQVGYGANKKDDDFGVAGWFDWETVQQPHSGDLPVYGKGDINADLRDCADLPDPVCEPTHVRDEFDDVSFDNNDGDDDWTSGWIEDDPEWDGEGASKGAVRVKDSALRLDDNEDTGGEPSAARTADLSGGGSCTLSFDYDTDSGVDEEDAVTVEISSDGGASWDTLEVITGIEGSHWDSSSFDVSDWASAETTVRFRVSAYYGGDDEHIWIDDVDISCVCD